MTTQNASKTCKGQKTETRRLVKQSIDLSLFDNCHLKGEVNISLQKYLLRFSKIKAGNKLYIKEPYHLFQMYDTCDLADILKNEIVFYGDCENPNKGKARNALYMPQCYSRCEIEIIDVRVEFLPQITVQGCLNEGISEIDNTGLYPLFVPKNIKQPYKYLSQNGFNPIQHNDMFATVFIRDSYMSLWDSINPSNTYETSPLVFVYSFKKA
jgi:hypothetical protein